MNAIARVTLKAEAYGGQEVVNTFWYRPDFPIVDPLEVMTSTLDQFRLYFVPKMLAIQTSNYLIKQVEGQLYESVTWVPLLSEPLVQIVDLSGSDTTHDVNGPAQCMIVKFVLDAGGAVIPAGLHLPKRSYIAVGPLSETVVDTSGNVVIGNFPGASITEFLAACAGDLLYLVRIWEAIRVGVPLPGTLPRAYASILSAHVRTKSSFRRSRNN